MPKRWIVGGVASTIFLGAIGWKYVRSFAPRWLETVRLRVAVPDLEAVWDGVRIAHLTDLHAGGPGVRLDMLWRARRIAEAFEPDIIAITGDFYDHGRPTADGGLFLDWPESAVVVGVLGNHDLRGTDAGFAALLDRLGTGRVRLLRNEAFELSLRGRNAWIAGVDDPFTFRDDLPATLDNVPDDADVLLLLAHSPAVIRDLPVGRARLVLAGHTHGGQIRLLPSGRVPFVNTLRRIKHDPPRNDPPFYRGARWLRGAIVVVPNGLGLSELPFRFRTRPQVVLIELSHAPAHGPACDDVARYVERLNPAPWPLRWLS